MRLSSGVARRDWKRVHSASFNCSRLDLQVTVRFAKPQAQVIETCWKLVRSHWLKHPHLAEPEIHAGPHGPHSFSFGSRSSDRCGRGYDKEYESKLDYYRGAVRFEGEFKGQVSKRLASVLSREDGAEASVIPHVLGLFRKWAVPLELRSLKPAQLCCPAKPTDAARRLRYLHTAIRPLILALIAQGMEREVLEALGLSEPAGPTLDQWN